VWNEAQAAVNTLKRSRGRIGTAGPRVYEGIAPIGTQNAIPRTEQLIPTTGIDTTGTDLGSAAANRENVTPGSTIRDAQRAVDEAKAVLSHTKSGSAEETRAKAALQTAKGKLDAVKAKSKGGSPIRQISENYLDDVLGNRNPATPDLIPV